MNDVFKKLIIRENTLDEYICNEIISSYGHLQFENNIIMDVGACFGAFTYYALLKDCKFIYSYEPVVENYELLVENTKEYDNIQCRNVALVKANQFENKILFYPGSGKNKGIGSFVKYRGREEIVVNSIDFYDELNRIKPDIIKMDIEGGEYSLISEPLPSFVKEFVVELHLNRKIWRTVEAKRIISYFNETEWNIVKNPKITKGNWTTLGSWVRL